MALANALTDLGRHEPGLGQDVALIKTQVFRWISGFCVGHVAPEAQVGEPIALMRDGDVISINADDRQLSCRV